MPLKSLWFSENERLQRCLVNDQAHVKPGETGMHVLLIQEALGMLDNVVIDGGDIKMMRYGRSTASAVLAYKVKRKIINRAYESSADDIVGKMTMAALDAEMQAQEQIAFQVTVGGLSFLKGLFFSPTVSARVKGVVVTETNAPWLTWATTFSKTFAPIGAGMVKIENAASPELVTHRLELAATMAGPGGFLVLNVGHGGHNPGAFTDEGFFDLGPHASFRLGGRNALLVGDPPPSQGPSGKPSHVSAFYDLRVPNPILKNGFVPSRKDDDEASSTEAAKTRLANWALYERIGKKFGTIGLSGVILLACKVGSASGFLARVRQQWGVPIIAYKRKVVGLAQTNGRTRIFLEGDADGSGTNTPYGEFLFPLSADMVVFK